MNRPSLPCYSIERPKKRDFPPLIAKSQWPYTQGVCKEINLVTFFAAKMGLG
jgi:hypothetical protein